MNEAPHWEHFSHGADIGVRGVGETAASAFAQAALAMMAVITDPTQIAALKKIHIACEAPDLELLLADWLNALIYEISTRKMLFSRFDVEITNHQLQAVAYGDNMDIAKDQPAVEVKGATYTELCVAQQANGLWLAQCIVDV